MNYSEEERNVDEEILSVEESYDGKLFPFQEELINIVTKKGYNKNPILCAPTGAGKTRIGVEIINKLKGKYIFLFIAPSIVLIDQTIEEINKNGNDLSYGKIQAENTFYDVNKNDVIIVSKMSRDDKMEELKECVEMSGKKIFLIFDECHLSIFKTIDLIRFFHPDKYIGLTATPERYDGEALCKVTTLSIYDVYDQLYHLGAFDECIDLVSIPDLVKIGRLSKLRLFVKPIEEFVNYSKITKSGEITDENFLNSVFESKNIYGDVIEMYKKYGHKEDGTPKITIGFAPSIKVAKIVTEALNSSLGTNFKVITSYNSLKERNEMIKQLEAKEISGLICSDLLAIGFNCKEVEYAFSLKHVKSKAYYMQIVGRVIRACEGKTEGIFVDHGDSISNFISEDCINIFERKMDWNTAGDALDKYILVDITSDILNTEKPEFKSAEKVVDESNKRSLFQCMEQVTYKENRMIDFENSMYIVNDEVITFDELKTNLAKDMYINGEIKVNGSFINKSGKNRSSSTRGGVKPTTELDIASLQKIIEILNNGSVMSELTEEFEQRVIELMKMVKKPRVVEKLKEERQRLLETNRELQTGSVVCNEALRFHQCQRLVKELKRLTIEKEMTHGVSKNKLRLLYVTPNDEEAYRNMEINLRDLIKLYNAPIEVKHITDDFTNDRIILSNLKWEFDILKAEKVNM